jgi:uncharacterized membrane protein
VKSQIGQKPRHSDAEQEEEKRNTESASSANRTRSKLQHETSAVHRRIERPEAFGAAWTVLLAEKQLALVWVNMCELSALC